jgi:outer membrane scaffolding protein for murein synthesis (MipA/OmpV family)
MGGVSMNGLFGIRRRGLRPGFLLPLTIILSLSVALPIGEADAEGRYNDWELWTSSANAVLPAKQGSLGPFRLNVAAGAAAAPEYLGSDSIAMKPLPLVDLNYAGALFLSTQQGVGWNMWRKTTLRAGPRITFDYGRLASDSPKLAGLPDIELGTELGLFLEGFSGAWRFKSDIRQEVGGGHGGLLLNGEVAWGSRWSKNASIILGGRMTYMDDTYAESYFSIAAANATAGRSTYAAAGGFRDANAYVQLIYDFTQAFYVSTELRGTMLMEQAADSPISESDAFFTGSVMVGYRF